MEKIKDITKGKPGDFIQFCGTLYVIKEIKLGDDLVTITVENDRVLNLGYDASFVIYRTEVKKFR